MTGDGRILRRLTDRQVHVELDRSRICRMPHPDPATMTPELLEELADFVCPWCAGTGFLPRDEGVDLGQTRHYRTEPLPQNHPAATNENFIVGHGPGPRHRGP